MDYISLYYGLYTILANCAKLGETAGEMRSVYALNLSLPRMPLEGLRWEPQTRQRTKQVAVVKLQQCH